MMPLVLALMLGVSGTLLVWSLRGWLRARWDADIAWLSHAVWRFTPEPFDARPYVAHAPFELLPTRRPLPCAETHGTCPARDEWAARDTQLPY